MAVTLEEPMVHGRPGGFDVSVSDETGKRVGFLQIALKGSDRAIVLAVDVDESTQRQGIATQLYETARQELKNRGIKTLGGSLEGSGPAQIRDRVFGRGNTQYFHGGEEVSYDEAVKIMDQDYGYLKAETKVAMTIPLSAAVDVVEGVGNRAVKTAISLPELVRQTNAFSKKYRGGCQPKLLDSNPKALFLHYNVVCQKSDSDPAGHDVRVQFDVTKVQESQKAKDLDIQVQCSCPAFLYWGAQWNLHQRDGLLGPSRPKLQAPSERLDLRGNYVICKHIHAVFERILPSVQHNIVNILRKRHVEEYERKRKRTPEQLKEDADKAMTQRQLEKIRKMKDKEIKQKLLDALKGEEEARMIHEKELEEQVPEGAVERSEPATGEHPAPKPAPADLAKLPKHYQPREEQEIADIEDLTNQEEAKIEQLHKENKPHIHKGLPYEEEE
jgi:GNAT superfamily N-acetyltransferase